MTLRNRFTLISSISFGIVAIVTFLIVFFAFYDSSKNSHFKALKNTALIAGIYYLEKDELPSTTHAEIKQKYRNVIESHMVAVYDEKNQVAFGKLANDPEINKEYLDFARQNKSVQFMSTDFFYYGIYYPDNQGDFVVFVKASNAEFKSQIYRLLVIMLAVLLLGLVGIFFMSRYLSKVVYKPITKVVTQINNADYNNISKAITTTGTNDEIGDLIKSYNKLLNRISESILVQQNFINYVSHEFKTPLAAISGNLEVFAQRERTAEEYQKVTKDALENVYKIEDILNNLLLMSGLKNLDLSREKVRIDEIVWNIYEGLKNKAAEKLVTLKIDFDVHDATILEQNANETLLQLAIFNIVENAIKYTKSGSVVVHLFEAQGLLNILVEDTGRGIPSDDLEKIYETFYRGNNVDHEKGSGIGLSLAKSILDQHHVQLNITSKVGKGTFVSMIFPKN